MSIQSPWPASSLTQRRRSRAWVFLTVMLVLALLLAVDLLLFYFHLSAPPARPGFFASLDTMKVSRDTETRPLATSEIASIVKLSADLNTNYITVDTHWDYADYMERWINAIRDTGRHVWFRIHPNQWENNNHTTGIMTLEQYKAAETQFILAHPSFFKPDDIFDPCPEPEQGHYWKNRYGEQWTYNAPNAVTREFNAFLRDTTDVADQAFQQLGISNVITTVRSTNSFFATHSDVLEQETVNKFGRITVDSYPERTTLNPQEATQARLDELRTINQLWHVPIVIGEMGYSNNMAVDDATQLAVLKAEFAALRPLGYLAGVNYWVGSGSNTAGGYTYLLQKVGETWSTRPAAQELAAFYSDKSQQQASR